MGEFTSILTGCWNQQVRLACISCVHVDLRNHVHAQVVVGVVEGMEDDDDAPAPYPRTVPEDENGENRDRERDDDGGCSDRRKRTRSGSDAQDDEGDASGVADATSEPDEGDGDGDGEAGVSTGVSIGDVCDVATEEGLKAWLRGRFGDSFRCRVSFRKARTKGNRQAYVQVKCGLGPSDHRKPDRRTADDAKRRKGNSAKVDCGWRLGFHHTEDSGKCIQD